MIEKAARTAAKRVAPRGAPRGLSSWLARVALVAASIVLSPIVAAQPAAPPTTPAHPVASPQPAAAATPADVYKLHMENGVKLFEDRNYDAARAEFRAAYEAKPKASPLINIALAHKAEFNYPKAIEALEAALAKHRDTMSAADIKAAEGELKDMRALIARVTIHVSPPEAKVTVDGETIPAATLEQAIPLGPGTHRIAAAAPGFVPAEQRLTVAGGEASAVTLTLDPDQGSVVIEAPDPRMTISVDERVVGTGAWTGSLSAGAHSVRITGAGGQPFLADILVVGGKSLTVRPGADQLPPPPPIRKEPPPPPTRHGVYAVAMGALLFPTRHPAGFPSPEINSGAAGGLRVGYQVNSVAGFDAFYEHSSLYTPSTLADDSGYTLISNRIGGDLRLMTPGKLVRGVGVIGGGLVLDSLSFDRATTRCGSAPCLGASGADPFLLLEAGLEFEFSGVLLGLALQTEFQSSRGISARAETSPPFSNDPLIHLGPGLRVGFAFW